MSGKLFSRSGKVIDFTELPEGIFYDLAIPRGGPESSIEVYGVDKNGIEMLLGKYSEARILNSN